jgi:LacI family transcriptional regulator
MAVRVPQELSVVGFDDSPLAGQVWPALTTVRQPIADMSAQAADLLLDLLSDRSTTLTRRPLPSSLVFRHATGPAPLEKSTRAE